MKQIFLWAFVVFLVLPTACTKITAEGGQLEEVNWQLIEYTIKQQKHIPLSRESVTLALVNGQLNGNGGCNRYFGSYAIDGSQLDISAIGATEMACPGLMQQEQEYFDLLQNAESFTSKDHTLIIYAKRGNLVFKSAP